MNRPDGPEDDLRSALVRAEEGLVGEQPPVADWTPLVRQRLARRRAQRGGAAAGALLLFALALYVLPGIGTDDRASLVATAPATGSPAPEPSVSAAPEPTPTQTPTPAPGPHASPEPDPTGEPPPIPSRPLQAYEGRVVDGAGQPLAGIQVWAVSVNTISGRPADTVSGADGTFTLPCGRGHKGLLGAWQLGQRQPPATRNLAPVFTGGARGWDTAQPLQCERETTTMRAGAVIRGTMAQATESGTEPVPDHQEMFGGAGAPDDMDLQGSILARWDPVDDAYRFVGLPSGDVRVEDEPNSSMNGRYAVTAGQVRTLNWVRDCRTCPASTPTSTPQDRQGSGLA